MQVLADIRVTLPPSINHAWKIGGGRAIKSPAYKAAINMIGWEVVEGRSKGKVARGKHEGLMVAAVVHSSENGGDADNRTKAVIDCLAKAQVFSNDSNILGGIYAISPAVPVNHAHVILLAVPEAVRPEGVTKAAWGVRRAKGAASKAENLSALLGMLQSRGIL